MPNISDFKQIWIFLRDLNRGPTSNFIQNHTMQDRLICGPRQPPASWIYEHYEALPDYANVPKNNS